MILLCSESCDGIIILQFFFQSNIDIDYSDIRYRESFPPGTIRIHSFGGGARDLQSMRIVGKDCAQFCVVIYTLDFGIRKISVRQNWLVKKDYEGGTVVHSY